MTDCVKCPRLLGVRGWAGHWHWPTLLSRVGVGAGEGRRGESMTKVKISQDGKYFLDKSNKSKSKVLLYIHL